MIAVTSLFQAEHGIIADAVRPGEAPAVLLVVMVHDKCMCTDKDKLFGVGVLIPCNRLLTVASQGLDGIKDSLRAKIALIARTTAATDVDDQRLGSDWTLLKGGLAQRAVVHHPSKIFVLQAETLAERHKLPFLVIDDRLQALQ